LTVFRQLSDCCLRPMINFYATSWREQATLDETMMMSSLY